MPVTIVNTGTFNGTVAATNAPAVTAAATGAALQDSAIVGAASFPALSGANSGDGAIAAGPAYVAAQSFGTLSASPVTVTVRLPSPPGAPVMVMVTSNHSGQSITVTDSRSSTYTQQQAVTGSVATFIFTAVPAGGLAPGDTVSVAFTSVTSSYDVTVVACPAGTAVDMTAIANGTGTAPSAALATSTANELVVAAVEWNPAGGAGTISSPFTELLQIEILTAFYIAIGYYLKPTAGTATATYTITSAVWRAAVASFTPAGAAIANAQAAGASGWAAVNAGGGPPATSPTPATAAASASALDATVTSSGTLPTLGMGDNVVTGNYGGVSQANAFTVWTARVGRPLQVFRQYYPGLPPTLIDADLKSAADAGLKVVLSFKPNAVTLSSTERTAIGVFLDSCVAYGMQGVVTMYHEPVNEGLTQPQYAAMAIFYQATIRARYPYIYCGQCTNGGKGTLANWQAYYTAGCFDGAALDFYATAYTGGRNMDSAAAFTDAQGLTNFSVYEMGLDETTTTQANGTAYWNYMISFFSARRAAGKGIGAICHFSSTPDGISGIPFTTGDYQIALEQQLWDAMN